LQQISKNRKGDKMNKLLEIENVIEKVKKQLPKEIMISPQNKYVEFTFYRSGDSKESYSEVINRIILEAGEDFDLFISSFPGVYYKQGDILARIRQGIDYSYVILKRIKSKKSKDVYYRGISDLANFLKRVNKEDLFCSFDALVDVFVDKETLPEFKKHIISLEPKFKPGAFNEIMTVFGNPQFMKTFMISISFRVLVKIEEIF
jgi:hypothetical protein